MRLKFIEDILSAMGTGSFTLAAQKSYLT